MLIVLLKQKCTPLCLRGHHGRTCVEHANVSIMIYAHAQFVSVHVCMCVCEVVFLPPPHLPQVGRLLITLLSATCSTHTAH